MRWKLGRDERLILIDPYTPNGFQSFLDEKDEADESVRMQGIFGHSLLEVYYGLRAKGADWAEAFKATMEAEIKIPECEFCGDIQENHGKLVPLTYTSLCIGFKPKKYPLPQPLQDQVRDKVKMYLYFYAPGGKIDIIPEAVELGFSEKIFENSGRVYILEGRIDLLGRFQTDQKLVLDHKFQSKRRSLYGRSVQFRNYAMVARVNFFLVNYLRLTQKTDAETFERKLISFNNEDHIHWKNYVIGIFDSVFENIIRDMWDNPKYGENLKNWGACQGAYSICPYTTLCEEQIPAIVKWKKQSLFTVGKEWRPW